MSADTATARGRAGSYTDSDDTAGLPIVSDGHGGWYGYAGADHGHDQGFGADGYATEYASDYGYDAAHEFGYDTGYTGYGARYATGGTPAWFDDITGPLPIARTDSATVADDTGGAIALDDLDEWNDLESFTGAQDVDGTLHGASQPGSPRSTTPSA